MNNKKIDGWKLYRKMFKDGEEIVVIDDDDKIYWGKLRTTENSIVLKRSLLVTPIKSEDPKVKRISGKVQLEIELLFDTIRFISHDGFPVKKCRGADDGESITMEDNSKLIKKLRQPEEEIKNTIETALSGYTYTPSITFGHPYTIENIERYLINPGNVSKDFIWDDHKYEEVMIMESKDSAKAMLWDIPSIFVGEV